MLEVARIRALRIAEQAVVAAGQHADAALAHLRATPATSEVNSRSFLDRVFASKSRRSVGLGANSV